MREILFRGKRIDNGEWVEGYYVRLYGSNGRVSRRIYTPYAEVDCGDYYPDFFDVQPTTVGQYTGLTDKNGKKIFEGDVGTGRNMLHPQRNKYEVVYEDNGFYFCDEKGVTWHPEHIDYFEIVGNIHDNPELLEVSHE